MAVPAIEAIAEPSKTVQRDLQRLRQSTRQVVGTVFYGTLLKTMRASNLKGHYGHGGRGEEVFQAQLDALIAERMGTASRGGLAETLYRRLEQQQERISAISAKIGKVNE